MSSPDYTLVGSGLVGSLLALFLARRGAEVRLLERRPDLRKERVRAGRSINLAISVRGLHALGQVGLAERALEHAIPMRGRMIHPLDGPLAFQPYGKDDTQCIHSISRSWLNGMLMSEAEATGRVRIDFRRRVTAVDVASGSVAAVNEHTGTEEQLSGGGALVGTDGAGSLVRMAVIAAEGGSSSEQRLEHGYKELTLPPGPGGSFCLEKHALHIWPRRDFMLIALPNLDGSFTCTLFLRFEGTPSFQTLRAPEEVRSFFTAHFPDAVGLLPDLETQFFENPTGGMVTVKCWPWTAEARALLLGDAAHAIVPFFGQGMNCGFEDCVVLDEMLARGNLPSAFADFARLRKPNADAIADMAVENFVEMRDSVADARFLLEKSIERRLLNAFPGEFLSRYALVTFSRVPYRVAYEVGRVAGALVSELASGVTSAEQVDLAKARRLVHERLAPLTSTLPAGPAH